MLGCLIFGAVPGKAIFANKNNKALFPGSSREEGYIVFGSTQHSGALYLIQPGMMCAVRFRQ